MTVSAQLPRRVVGPGRVAPAVAAVEFMPRTEFIASSEVAPDMGDLAARVRSLMALQHLQVLRLPLGGSLFDIIVTASGPEAYAAVAVLDEIQHSGEEHADACGPVIEDPQRSWLVWLVPPGTSEQWVPHRHAMSLGRPHQIALPPIAQTEPPGPYWLRPCRGDRLVPPTVLRQLLDQFQPGPVPHETLIGAVLSTIS